MIQIEVSAHVRPATDYSTPASCFRRQLTAEAADWGSTAGYAGPAHIANGSGGGAGAGGPSLLPAFEASPAFRSLAKQLGTLQGVLVPLLQPEEVRNGSLPLEGAGRTGLWLLPLPASGHASAQVELPVPPGDPPHTCDHPTLSTRSTSASTVYRCAAPALRLYRAGVLHFRPRRQPVQRDSCCHPGLPGGEGGGGPAWVGGGYKRWGRECGAVAGKAAAQHTVRAAGAWWWLPVLESLSADAPFILVSGDLPKNMQHTLGAPLTPSFPSPCSSPCSACSSCPWSPPTQPPTCPACPPFTPSTTERCLAQELLRSKHRQPPQHQHMGRLQQRPQLLQLLLRMHMCMRMHSQKTQRTQLPQQLLHHRGWSSWAMRSMRLPNSSMLSSMQRPHLHTHHQRCTRSMGQGQGQGKRQQQKSRGSQWKQHRAGQVKGQARQRRFQS